jgi:hypothetical protein
VSTGKDSRTNPWDAQKLDVTGSWSASKSTAPRKRTAKIPETLVAPDIDPLPDTPDTGDLLAGRFESSDESSPSFDWDPDGDTDSVPPVEEHDTAEAEAHADALDVELLAAADPSTDAPTGEMTIPSFGPDVTLESQAPPRVVQGRVPNGFVTEGSASSVWANTPIRAKAIKDAPRIELRRRRHRPLVKIDDASAGETTEWMAQGVARPTRMRKAFPSARASSIRRMAESTSRRCPTTRFRRSIPSRPNRCARRRRTSSTCGARRVDRRKPIPFRAFVLNRRGPEEETEPPPPWAGMISQTAKWILVVAGGIGLGCLVVMALTGHLPF